MNTANTAGAMRAAAVIMNGKKKIATEYGEKTAEGIADLIDRETGAGELLEALKEAEAVLKAQNNGNCLASVLQAIAKAEGK